MFLDSYLKLHTLLMLHDQISIDDYIDAKIIKNRVQICHLSVSRVLMNL